MTWIARGNLKGPTGTIDAADAVHLPTTAEPTVTLAGTPAHRKMSFGIPRANSVEGVVIGDDDHLHVHLTDGSTLDAGVSRGAQGLPGFEAVPTDAGVAGLISTTGTSETKAAVKASIGAEILINRTATMNLRKEVTPSGMNDTVAVNSALAAFAAAGGGKVIIPRDDWKFVGATGLDLTGTTAPIHIEAEEGTVFDMTGLTAATGMVLGGSVGASAPLGADVARFSESLTTTLAVEPGDIIRIQSTDRFTPDLATAVKGELAEVLSSEAGVITLKSGLWDSYSAATTTVTKMGMPRVSVENLTLLRDGANGGLTVMYGRDVLLGGLYAEGARERLFMVSNALGVTLDNLRGRDFYDATTGTSYGLSVASCQDVTETGLNLKGGRVAVAHGGTFPTRNVQVIGGTFDSYHPAGRAAFDFHPNCENVRMIGSTALNGIIVNGSNFEGTNLTIRTGAAIARPGVEFGLWQSGDYLKLQGCDIQTGGAASDGVVVINRTGAVPTNTKLIQIDGTIRGGVNGVGVRVNPATANDTGATVERLELSGDISGSSALAMQKDGAAEIVVAETKVSGRLTGNAGSTVTVSTTGGSRLVYTDADVVTRSASRAAHTGASAGTLDVIIRNSRLAAVGVSGDRNYFGAGRLEIQDSTIEGFAAVGGVSAASASEALISNVRGIGNSGAMALPGRHYSRVNAAGKVTTHGTAAPTSGTWAAGDRCERTNPVVGQPTGWVCTAAGTPGTWVPLANL